MLLIMTNSSVELWEPSTLIQALDNHSLGAIYAKQWLDKHIPTATKSPASLVRVSMEVVWQTRSN
jgi:hypothetical protein